MADYSESQQTLALSDIEFCQLDESRHEEFRINVNEWYSSLDSNSAKFNLRDFTRLTEDEFRNYLDEGTVMYIAKIKTTNEMVGTIGIEKPHICKDRLTSAITLRAVRTEYRRLGIGKLLNDEIVKVAKQMGVENISMESSYYGKFITEDLIKNGYTLTGTMIQHKSNYTKSLFQRVEDYFVFNCFEKAI